MLLDMMAELMGSWSGVLSLLVIALSAIGIPLGVVWALMHQYKGPVELANHPVAPEVKHSEWHHQRYSH